MAGTEQELGSGRQQRLRIGRQTAAAHAAMRLQLAEASRQLALSEPALQEYSALTDLPTGSIPL